MKVKIVKKNGKYKKRFSLDVDEWMSIIIGVILLILIGIVVIIQFILWG